MASKVPKKTAGKNTPTKVEKIPEFKHKVGKLVKLNRLMFPKTREGKMAHCDYMIASWTLKKEAASKRTDAKGKAKAKLQRRLDKLKEKREALEAEIATYSTEEDEEDGSAEA